MPRPPATSTTIKQSTKQRSLSQVLQQLTCLLPPCRPLKLHSRWLIRLMLVRHLLALHPRFRNKALTCNSVLPVESDTFNLTDFRPPSLLHTLLAVYLAAKCRISIPHHMFYFVFLWLSFLLNEQASMGNMFHSFNSDIIYFALPKVCISVANPFMFTL